MFNPQASLILVILVDTTARTYGVQYDISMYVGKLTSTNG